MKPTMTTLIALVCSLGLVFVAGCEKSNADLGEDILSEMLEIQVDTTDDYLDIVEDQYDICNKTVRDTTALVEQREGQMRGLAAQWNKLKANSTAKDQREAVNRVGQDYAQYYKDLEAQQEKQYMIFEEFQKHCAGQTAQVYQLLNKTTELFTTIMGHEFY